MNFAYFCLCLQNCKVVYLLDLKSHFGRHSQYDKSYATFRFHFITHNLCVLVIPKCKKFRILLMLAKQFLSLYVTHSVPCWTCVWHTNACLRMLLRKKARDFFFLSLFSTWFIDFLLNIFQDDFYDTSKRARVITNNNKSSIKAQPRYFRCDHTVSESE